MRVMVNGEIRILEGTLSVAELLQRYGLVSRMVVVEHNHTIVPRDRYALAALNDGDTLEIVQMMAGG